jgi:hypothetical protein
VSTANVIPITAAAAVAPQIAQLDTVAVSDDATEQPAQQRQDPRVMSGAASAALAALAGGPGPLAHSRAQHGVHVNSQSAPTPWGTPMDAPAEPKRNPHVRPDSESGWGRTESDLLPNGKKPELARVILEISEPLTISVDVLQNPGETVTEPTEALTVWALVTFGNGSTNVTRAIRCDYRFDVTVVASYVQVQVYIGLIDDPAPYVAPQLYNPVSPPQPPAQVAVQVARGTRGLPYVASQFSTAEDVSENVLAEGALRLLSIEAHLTDTQGAPQFLQIYDQAAAVGPSGPPAIEYPLGTTPYPGLMLTRFLNPRGLALGMFVVVSDVSGEFSPSGATAHFEFERWLL